MGVISLPIRQRLPLVLGTVRLFILYVDVYKTSYKFHLTFRFDFCRFFNYFYLFRYHRKPRANVHTERVLNTHPESDSQI